MNLIRKPGSTATLAEDIQDFHAGEVVVIVEMIDDPRGLAPPYYLVKSELGKAKKGYVFEEDFEPPYGRRAVEENPTPTAQLRNKLLR